MKTIEKLRNLLKEELDQEALEMAVKMGLELLKPFLVLLELENTDQKKLKLIQSTFKKSKKESKYLMLKSAHYLELVREFNKAELIKMEKNQHFFIPPLPELSDIFKENKISSSSGLIEHYIYPLNEQQLETLKKLNLAELFSLEEPDQEMKLTQSEDLTQYYELTEEEELNEVEAMVNMVHTDVEELSAVEELSDMDSYNSNHIVYTTNMLLNSYKRSIILLAFCLELNNLEKEYLNKLELAAQRALPETTASGMETEKELSPGGSETLDSSKVIQIFKEGGYELFCYLNREYSRDDNNPKAKYSYLYHFLRYHELLICTKLQYIGFIESKMGLHLSRIQDSTLKYEDIILPLLGRIKTQFSKNCTS